jgi:hypothetical protein
VLEPDGERKGPEASSPVSGKHEPIDLFGDSSILVDRLAMGPECHHTSLEIVF